ncbi:hypothetical protein [Chitinophaga sp. CF418]|uniref:DUF6929 family protein n=1 Tax=Chitinophaga sp. CF418 TaxID=1855287 RepID=UPI0009110EC7|nr:hypothetical protein [Chitinophaga sp. CF418]SHN00722.1 hypothetical protein SAMN05216311_104298 [Chitinophaga sp. CF418]
MKAIITLLKSLLLSDYPSGSSINYYNGHLYIIGDDANKLLVLDSNYNEVSAVPFFDYEEKRIPKVKKADLETAVILDIDGGKSLLAFGSAATKERKTVVLLRLRDNKVQYISYTPFVNRLQQIPEINVEGATIVGPHLILANRGNKSNPVNNFITTTPDFWQRQEDVSISISKLIIPFSLAGFAGISELCYIEQEDVLLVVLSSEDTGNTFDDGVIGDSYIGWVKNISQKLNEGDILLDGIVNLSDADPAFKGEKLEGVCLSAVTDNGWYLHLVADNDQGESRLFHIKILLG